MATDSLVIGLSVSIAAFSLFVLIVLIIACLCVRRFKHRAAAAAAAPSIKLQQEQQKAAAAAATKAGPADRNQWPAAADLQQFGYFPDNDLLLVPPSVAPLAGCYDDYSPSGVAYNGGIPWSPPGGAYVLPSSRMMTSLQQAASRYNYQDDVVLVPPILAPLPPANYLQPAVSEVNGQRLQPPDAYVIPASATERRQAVPVQKNAVPDKKGPNPKPVKKKTSRRHHHHHHSDSDTSDSSDSSDSCSDSDREVTCSPVLLQQPVIVQVPVPPPPPAPVVTPPPVTLVTHAPAPKPTGISWFSVSGGNGSEGLEYEEQQCNAVVAQRSYL